MPTESKVEKVAGPRCNFKAGTLVKVLWSDNRWWNGLSQGDGSIMWLGKYASKPTMTPHKSVLEIKLADSKDLVSKDGRVLLQEQPEALRKAQAAAQAAKAPVAKATTKKVASK